MELALESRPLAGAVTSRAAAGTGAVQTKTCVTGKVRLGEARLLLSGMQDRDVLIIDEVHQLVQGGRVQAEWLLHYLQDGVLLGPLGPEEMPKVTIIACSTEAAKLPETILSRFVNRPDLVEYTAAEAAEIAAGMAVRTIVPPLPQPTSGNCLAIAEAASRSPRLIRAVLITLRDIALTTGGGNWTGTEYDLTQTLDWMGLTPDGLDRLCQRYLAAMFRGFRGEPVGLSALMEQLQEPGGLAHTERLLASKGYITFTKPGRVLTQPGLARARALDRP